MIISGKYTKGGYLQITEDSIPFGYYRFTPIDSNKNYDQYVTLSAFEIFNDSLKIWGKGSTTTASSSLDRGGGNTLWRKFRNQLSDGNFHGINHYYEAQKMYKGSSTQTPAKITFDVGSRLNATKYRFGNSSNVYCTKWKFEGSSDKINWTILDDNSDGSK